jgi:hypothetical protein
MRTSMLVFGLLAACGPRPALLESGSYVPAAPEQARGLEGVNLTLDDGLAFFVTPDNVYERELTPLAEEEWRSDCAKDDEDEGTLEETFAVDGEPMEWPDGTVILSTLSGACDSEGGMRVIGTDAGGASDLEVILRPF